MGAQKLMDEYKTDKDLLELVDSDDSDFLNYAQSK